MITAQGIFLFLLKSQKQDFDKKIRIL